MKIVVAQFWTRNLNYGKFTKEINEKYCKEKGYEYFLENDDEKIYKGLEGRAYTWYKPKLILEVLQKTNPDYVLFLDADAIVSNSSYRIEEFIEEGYDCVVTEDYGPSVMNAGVLLFKNTNWTKNFLKDWWDVSDKLQGPDGQPSGFYNHGLWHDQTCFGHLYKSDVNNSEKIKIIDNKVLNGRVFRDFHNKNFIFHAFSYGNLPNRTIDNAYYEIFNIEKPKSNDLTDIVEYYNTDKHYEHDYFNLIYNELFRKIKLEVKNFIEIGVDKGGSLELWRDYFDNAIITGADFYLHFAESNFQEKNNQRIKLIKLNQSNEDDLYSFSKLYDQVDVILDDGSHKMKDQQITFAKLFKMLKSGGIYIIEDLHTSLEAVLPEKAGFEWGDPNKTLTLDMLKEFQISGKIISDYMSNEDMEYLSKNISSVNVYQSKPNWSITSVIIKK
jgi:hypothetical protein